MLFLGLLARRSKTKTPNFFGHDNLFIAESISSSGLRRLEADREHYLPISLPKGFPVCAHILFVLSSLNV